MKNDNRGFDKKLKVEDIDKLIGEKFGNYSKYIIQDRALPDLRDGLKPVQRRILFAMNKLGLGHRTPHKKSARVVGDVIGKYHPHGDTSVYEAMVRMSQIWKMNLPLVDMHGNNGSIDGDSPAAMRYTESRLSGISSFLLLNIEKLIVPFTLNFDDTEKEPTVLPALFPNLLVNGSTGIASGYSTNIPPHNFNEVVNALIFVLENYEDDFKYSDLKKIIKGPDFPTGGTINGRNSIDDCYRYGKGKIDLRAKYEINKKASEIYITEIPFEASKSEIVKEISKIIEENSVPGIYDVRDDSGRRGLKITILLNPDSNFELILGYLFKHTLLEKPFHANMIAIQDKKPILLTLKNVLEDFAVFQVKIYLNLFQYELNKFLKRMEIVEALIILVKSINEAIKIIQKSTNKQNAKDNLIERFKFNDNQAEAIVNLKLYRLTSTDVENLYEDRNILRGKISFYQKGLNDRKFLIQNIIENLHELNATFIVPRRTEIVDKKVEEEINEIDLIIDKNVIVGITYEGYLKVMNESTNSNFDLKDYKLITDDFLLFRKTMSNLKKIFVFTTSGKYFVLPLYKFNEQKWTDIGEHLSKYFSMDVKDHVLTCGFFSDVKQTKENILLTTKKGKIKQIKVSDLQNQSTKKGLKIISLSSDDDALVSINVLKGEDYFVSTVSKSGNYLRYRLDQIPVTSTMAAGVTNMKLKDDDEVVKTIVIKAGNEYSRETHVLFLTKYARIKRVRFSDLKITSRAKRGSKILNQIQKHLDDEIIEYLNIDETGSINLMFKNKSIVSLLTKKITSISSTHTLFNWLYNNAEIVKHSSGKELVFNETPYDDIENKNQVSKDEVSKLNLEEILESLE